MNITIREIISTKITRIARMVCNHRTMHVVDRVGTRCSICGKMLTIKYPIGGSR